ncbi:MAG: right-handed parallel beta-helix repeat-containing protein [Bacteroidetes bacterium]|nr:right-handed parallel beta-helix repeat-containing protein [Bacteroidota bacterium]
MKQIPAYLIFLAVLIQVCQPSYLLGTQFIFGPDKPVIDGRGNASAVKPGDTIYLSASTRQYVLLRSLHGTSSRPILVQNIGGPVIFTNSNYGIKFDTCSWIRCIGKADSGSYGFLISVVNAGVAIQGLSTCIEVAGFEISAASWTGIVAKTDPDCSFKSTRGNYVMRNISIHDNYLHDITNEGMYIGHSYFSGYLLHCNGKDTVVYPHLIRGLNIYNNKVKNTGWDGIQVSSADSACYVNNNFIYLDSQAEASGQMSGFLLGGGSSCNCFSNFVKDGKGDGIDELGQGGNFIYNNLIVNPGKNLTGSGQKHGIYVGTQTPAAGRGYQIVFNTIVSPRTNGIDFRSTAAVNSVAFDNIIANPAGSYIKLATGTTLAQQDNLQVPNVSDVKFINSSSDNYDLLPSSPAVNKGSAVAGFTLNSDIIGRFRPWPWRYDIGAFECHDSSLLSVNEKINPVGIQIIRCFVKYGVLNVCLSLDERESLYTDVYSLQGKHISAICNSLKGPGLVEFEKFVGQLEDACYICIFRLGGCSVSRKIYAGSFK